MTKLENQNQLLQSEISRLKEGGDAWGRKMREYEAEIASLRGSVTDYESRLRSREASVTDFGFKETQYEKEIARLQSQCALLSQEIERLTEFGQKKY